MWVPIASIGLQFTAEMNRTLTLLSSPMLGLQVCTATSGLFDTEGQTQCFVHARQGALSTKLHPQPLPTTLNTNHITLVACIISYSLFPLCFKITHPWFSSWDFAIALKESMFSFIPMMFGLPRELTLKDRCKSNITEVLNALPWWDLTSCASAITASRCAPGGANSWRKSMKQAQSRLVAGSHAQRSWAKSSWIPANPQIYE